VKVLQQEGRLTNENFHVIGLPKVRNLKINLKLAKEEEEEKKTE